MILWKRNGLVVSLVAGTVLLGALSARAGELRGPIQSVGRNLLRVSNRVVRLDQRTILEDTGGNKLGVEELKPGVWVEVEMDGDSGLAERVSARVVR